MQKLLIVKLATNEFVYVFHAINQYTLYKKKPLNPS